MTDSSSTPERIEFEREIATERFRLDREHHAERFRQAMTDVLRYKALDLAMVFHRDVARPFLAKGEETAPEQLLATADIFLEWLAP